MLKYERFRLGRWPVLKIISWAVVAVIVIGVTFDRDFHLRYLLDMDVYVQGAKHFWTDDHLYTATFHTESVGLPFTYPPFGAVVFTPLWLLSEVVGLVITERVFTLMSIVALWCAARAIVVATKITHSTVFILAVLMCSLPVISTLDIGQINIVLMALIFIDISRIFPRLPLGVLTGLAAAIKLTPLMFCLFFLLMWIVHKKPQGLIAMASSFLGATLIAALIHPITSVTYWTDTLLSTSRIGEPWYAKNVSLKGSLARFPELNHSGLIWLGCCLVILVLTIIAVVRILRTDNSTAAQLLSVTLIALAALLCSPISWHHHWVWLGPLCCLLIFNRNYFLGAWAFFAQTAGAFHMFISGGGGDGQEFQWTPVEHLLATHYLWFAVVVLSYFAIQRRPNTTARTEIGTPASIA